MAGIVDALGLTRLRPRRRSSGAATAAAYTAARPHQVNRLVLYGSFARGADIAPDAARTALLEVIATHWGLGSRLLADVFVPGCVRPGACRLRQVPAAVRDPRPGRAVAGGQLRAGRDRSAGPGARAHPRDPSTRRPGGAVRAGARTWPAGSGVRRSSRSTASITSPGGATPPRWPTRCCAAWDIGSRPGRPSPGPTPSPNGSGRSSALVADGLTDAQIADRLTVSPHTVHRHIANARTKLGARSARPRPRPWPGGRPSDDAGRASHRMGCSQARRSRAGSPGSTAPRPAPVRSGLRSARRAGGGARPWPRPAREAGNVTAPHVRAGR